MPYIKACQKKMMKDQVLARNFLHSRFTIWWVDFVEE